MKCGIPYQGSKSNFVQYLADYFPPAENFYDLFGGGFAVTHYMLTHQKHKYQHFHFNEIKSDILVLIRDAIEGKYNYNVFKPAWVSRQEFFARKDSDAYVRCLWSFGNDQKTYLFGKNIEGYKRSLHQAIVFSEFDDLAKQVLSRDSWSTESIKERRLIARRHIGEYKKNVPDFLLPYLSKTQKAQLERQRSLQQLERLEQLKQLPGNLTMTGLDYRQVEIKPNSVVYCDIPYFIASKSYIKQQYGVHFDHTAFFEWAATRDFPVYFSEYNCDDPRFELVFEKGKRVSMAATGAKSADKTMERLYWNRR
jgi:site-specific DNA-adenine methylase